LRPFSLVNQQAQFTRRRFIGGSAAAGLAASLGTRAADAPGERKLKLGLIGAGGQGYQNLRQFSSESIVAFCDPDSARAAQAFTEFPDARKYQDFRELFEQERGLDAVVVSTPDHTHAAATMLALRRGLHVYCEKPLTRTIREARAIADAARVAGVATQMGNQGMAFEGNRLIKEWLADGAIGDVHDVHVWSDRPTSKGSSNVYWAQGVERPKETPPVPSTLNWDVWLGPAPARSYHPAYVPFKWRGWWDFGSGGLGDMGIHNLAPVFDALRLKAPRSVYASSTPRFEETLPAAAIVHFEFAARDGMPPVKVHWYDGGLMPARPDELEDGRELDREDGIIFVGEKGKILVRGWGGRSPRLIPETRMQAYRQPEKTLPRSIGHGQEWLRACREGTPTASNFQFAGPLTEAVLLGALCVRLGGRKLIWDSAKLNIVNLPDANALLHYAYRPGWTL
jgi:predicted dehydrogenase